MPDYYTAYGIHRATWKQIKSAVEVRGLNSLAVQKEYELDKIQTWFLFDKLLRGEFNHLYKREKLTPDDIKIGQFVYCDYPEYGRGEIVTIFHRDDEMPKAAKLMEVKFVNRKYPTMCDYEKMVTVHDNIKRKVTKL